MRVFLCNSKEALENKQITINNVKEYLPSILEILFNLANFAVVSIFLIF